jgi:hypothetical protein
MAARRRTILVFNDLGRGGVERLALGGGTNGGLYRVFRDPDAGGRELWGQGQWTLLRQLIDERRPSTIAVNISQTHAFSDGLSVGEWEQLAAALVCWLRQQVHDMGLGEWFPPSVSVQRTGAGARSSLADREDVVIERGDHLHTDFGIKAMGLATDTQHVGYVLKDGERDAPEGLRRASTTRTCWSSACGRDARATRSWRTRSRQ